jgi:hypothetical protein
MTLQTTILSSVKATQTNTLDLGTPIAQLENTLRISLADGSAANQASKIFSDTRTLIASASENLDLVGTLIDAFGNVLSFATIKVLQITAKSTNVNSVIVGNAASAGWLGPFGALTHTVEVRPGGGVEFTAPGTGWPVTATTADILKILNGGAGSSVDYNIMIIGT